MMQVLDRVLFLAARTTRSQAYAQAMARAGLCPSVTLYFGPARSTPAPTWPEREVNGVTLADLAIPLEQTVAAWGTEVLAVDEANVNAPEVSAVLAARRPDLIIYSGYGGQIVGPGVLDTAPTLHIHAGYLPEERGSTTVYYGIIRQRQCGVSALLLAPEIDAGPTLLRRRFPAPPAGLDLDHIWDGALRGAILAEVMTTFARTGRLPDPIQASESAGMYYVMHPLLRHIARLSLPNA